MINEEITFPSYYSEKTVLLHVTFAGDLARVAQQMCAFYGEKTNL